MNLIDVFSGIGGLSRALMPFANTRLYCEYDPYCQQVLYERMNDGRLDKAPIHGNVKTLHLCKSAELTMLCGGFPCTNVSSIGNMEGIKLGAQSSLFYELMRLLDENDNIAYVFLENVANICRIGMAEVIEELQKRDFDMYWTTRSASSMGAPHQRNRWFCLGVRRTNVQVVDLDFSGVDDLNRWTKNPEWPLRITYKGNDLDPTWDTNWISRLHTLGNTVCPCVVRESFMELWRLYKNSETLITTFRGIGRIKNIGDLSYPYPESGVLVGDLFLSLPPHQNDIMCDKVDISVELSGKNHVMRGYPTPRRGITHPSALTERSLHDLPTVLVNSSVAKAQMATSEFGIPETIQGSIIPNVNYIEWMMGYEADWTRVVGAHRPTHKTQKNVEQSQIADEVPKKLKIKTKGTNAMHLFFKDNPGKDVTQITNLWRNLEDSVKAGYINAAKAARDGCQINDGTG
jgi:DNA (cytosine-5)-methyltransferase 1